MPQIHKRFTSDQVKEFLDRYSKNEIERKYIQEILGIKRRRFFVLLEQYKENPQHFTVQRRHMGSPISCGLARPRSLVGEKPTQVAVSHGPGIQPCRCSGNRMLDA